jgi:Bacterial Ig domain/FG-GAP repeat
MKAIRTVATLTLVVIGLAGLALPADRATRAAEPAGVPANLPAPDWRAIEAQLTKLIAADGAYDDRFGTSVSLSGDTVVVGAHTADVGGKADQGAAYVFHRDQGGPYAWGQVAKLNAADGAAGDHFGWSASLGGDTIVVGAYLAYAGGNANQGAAYIFYRDQGGPDAWGQVAKLTAADGAAGDHFGQSVSLSGDTVVVGADYADVGGNVDQGTAYVFYRDQGSPDAWGQVAKLTAADGATGDRLGWSVSLNGDTVVVGAPFADVGGNADQGAAYAFYRDQGGPDAWGQVAKLTAADGAYDDRFGVSAALSADTVVVGAHMADVGGNAGQGAAYVFYRDQGGPGAWGQVAKLTAADGTAGDRFGVSAVVDGDAAVVGADFAQAGGNWGRGAAYAFYRNHGGPDAWHLAAKLTAADSAWADQFGWSVTASGGTVVDGAPFAEVGGILRRGAAYVHVLPPVAEDDAYTTPEDALLQVPAALGVLANDIDPHGYPLTAVLDAGPSHGALDLHADGSFTYTPTAGFAGLDTFSYHANDGQADSNVAAVEIIVNGAPVAAHDVYGTLEDTPLVVAEPGVLLNDTDMEGDPLTAVLDAAPLHGALDLHAGGSFVYTPTANFAGLDIFTYHANDGQSSSNMALVTLIITAVNDIPVAANDVYTTPVNVPLAVAAPGVLLNDTDVDNDPLTAVMDAAPLHGTLDLDANGAFLYTPVPHFIGVDTFTYHASDGQANSSLATVQIAVTGQRTYLPLANRILGSPRQRGR